MLGEPEVGDERLSRGVEEHVLGLQVPVHDPARVSPSERRGERPSEGERRLDADRTSEPLPECSSRHERHDEVRAPGSGARVEERHEPVLDREGAEEPLLPLEAGHALLLRPREDLEGHHLPRGRASPVDDAHAAPADRLQDLVGPYPHALVLLSRSRAAAGTV